MLKVTSNNIIVNKFEDIPTSTKTIIGITNLTLNIVNVFNKLPITKYLLAPKKRGRKKKEIEAEQNEALKCGDIITLKLGSKLKGIDLKKKKNTSSKHFRNAITVVMYSINKLINFKITSNGKFQFTGCKWDNQAEKCIENIWKYISDDLTCYSIRNNWDKLPGEDSLKVIYNVVMRNIDFNLGFFINREKLDKLVNDKTNYTSFLLTVFGYTGVNIKFPMKNPIIEKDISLRYGYYKDNIWDYRDITYTDYISTLNEKELTKEQNKSKYHTFLVFHSGNVILSGMKTEYMKSDFYIFLDIIKNNRIEIEETLVQN